MNENETTPEDAVPQPAKRDEILMPAKDVYELTKLRILGELEDDFIARLTRKLRNWGIVLAVAAGVAAIFGVTSFWSHLRSLVESTTRSEVDQRLATQLPRLQTRIDDAWLSGIRAKEAGDKASEFIAKGATNLHQMDDAMKELTGRVDKGKEQTDLLETKLAEQSAKAARLEQILKDFYSNSRADSIPVSDTNQVKILPIADGRLLVCFRVGMEPLPNSLRLQYHVFAQPPGSFFWIRNVVFFVWGESAENLRGKPLYALYAGDPTVTNLVQKLIVRGNAIYGDDELLMDLNKTVFTSPPPR